MCGIAGIVHFSSRPVDADLLARMSAAIAHRGPDDEGFVLIDGRTGAYRSACGLHSPAEVREREPELAAVAGTVRATVGLAHRRFSILELSSLGHQPFFDAERRVAVVFNGEVYNYVELRDDLKARGHAFTTGSDTEVIVEAYKRWGPGAFERLNGMWALALYEFAERRLVLSRDRLGKKPLYWFRSEDALYFASEIKALLEAPELERSRRVREAAVFPYLAQGLRDLDGATFFEGVWSLPAASWAVAGPDFPRTARRFWELPRTRLTERELGVEEASSALRTALADAVRIRLRADVPWAVELSGGMDSSVLLALAAQASTSPVPAYTVRFADPACNEEPFARQVAERWGAELRLVDAPAGSLWSELRDFTWLQEEPYHSPNLHSNQLIRRAMRAEGVKVLLNGAGGDELFAGYGYYFHAAQLENLRSGCWRRFVRNARGWTEGRSVFKTWLGPLVRPLRHHIREGLDRLGHARFPWLRARGRMWAYDLAPLSTVLLSDIANTRTPYWLRSGDKTQMGIPIEARAPFLDYRVVDLAFRLPPSYLVRDGWHKWILRRAFADLLPPAVLWRRVKVGFPFPLERFFAESAAEVAAIIERCTSPFVAPPPPGDPVVLWRLLSFLLWHQLFVRRDESVFDDIEALVVRRGVTEDGGFQPEFLRPREAAHGRP